MNKLLLLCLFAALNISNRVLVAADVLTLDFQGQTSVIVKLKGDFVIEEQIDLKGGIYKIPDCERIIFARGASIKNGTVHINPNTYEILGNVGIFENVVLVTSIPSGDIKVSLPVVNARWFGCQGLGNKDETMQLERALFSAHNLSIPLKIPRGTYLISKSLLLNEGDIILGEFAGQVGSNNQKGQTIIRSISSKDEILTVQGNHVEIHNLMLVCSRHYKINGINLKNGAIYFNLNNVLIGNTKYAIYSCLSEGKGVSQCKWENLVIRNAVRGISVDMNVDKGQYLTFNHIYNAEFLNIKEYGVYFHCKTINTQTFRDCLFTNIGYGLAYDSSYASIPIYAIYAHNDGKQGSINIDGGYFENIYYSKDGYSIRKNDKDNAVFYMKNMNCSISNVRFANTRTIIDAKGYDIINMSNCIDNGYINSKLPKVYICRKSNNSVIDVNGYNFANRDKGFIEGGIKLNEKEKISKVQLSSKIVVDVLD